MFKRRYYYLVAGFADLIFDSGKGYPDLMEFREELKNNLHPSDYHLVSLLFLPYDNDNMIAFLENKTDSWNALGNYSLEDFEEEKRVLQSVIKMKDLLPPYMVDVMSRYIIEENTFDRVSLWKDLNEGYIEMVLNSGNSFLKQWISYDRDVRNIFTLVNTKELDLDAERYLIGNDPFTQELISIFNSGRDFLIPQEPEYASSVFRIATENEFIDKERKIDMERWNFIDTVTFFEYFTIDLILGYLIKYKIVLRWKQLEPETGEMMLRKMIREMETQVMTTGLIN